MYDSNDNSFLPSRAKKRGETDESLERGIALNVFRETKRKHTIFRVYLLGREENEEEEIKEGITIF